MAEKTLSGQISKMSGVPQIESRDAPSCYSKAKELKEVLGDDTVVSLYWSIPKACLVLVTTKGRRIAIPKTSFFHPVAEMIEGRAAIRTYVEDVANLIRTRRPN